MSEFETGIFKLIKNTSVGRAFIYTCGHIIIAMSVVSVLIQKLKPGYPLNVGSLDKSKKPAFTKDDIDKGVQGRAPRPDYSTYKPGSYHDFDVGGDKPPAYIKVEDKGGKNK